MKNPERGPVRGFGPNNCDLCNSSILAWDGATGCASLRKSRAGRGLAIKSTPLVPRWTAFDGKSSVYADLVANEDCSASGMLCSGCKIAGRAIEAVEGVASYRRLVWAAGLGGAPIGSPSARRRSAARASSSRSDFPS